MRYFLPNIRLPCDVVQQSFIQDKLGGLPWGISESQWPKCKNCGKSQSLLAQFLHDFDRLDLGREGRVLNIFQCNHDPGMCSTWEGGAGANACFISEPEELADNQAQLPADWPPLEREVIITDWVAKEDDIDPSKESHFYSGEKYCQLPQSETDKVHLGTKVGGVPWWVQSPDEAPQGDWRFVGQLADFYSFLTPPSTTHEGISEDPDKWEGRTHYCDGPNFGGGTGYIFVRATTSTPEGCFFWQC
ncbi:MAG TPA: hypothetical protein VGE29_14270 [Prosthecobacter sp.]